jgi:hypothetical protein
MVDAPKPGGSLSEWFTRAEALREARAGAPAGHVAAALDAAEGMLAVAELALEPPEEFTGGEPNEAILTLIAEAFRVAGAAHAGLAAGASVQEVGAAIGAEALAGFVPEGATLDEILGWLGVGRSAAVRGVDIGESDRRLDVARAFVKAFVAHADRARLRARELEREGRVRPLVAIVAAVLVVLAVAFAAKRALTSPDLAAGKEFTASSAFSGFAQAGKVNVPVEYDVFAHTREEESPWIRVDLGAVESARTIEIQNRADCCRERAIPLVVEVSEDGNAWREVGRRDEDFRDWTIAMPSTRLRFVRASVPRRTFLHLARISVRR